MISIRIALLGEIKTVDKKCMEAPVDQRLEEQRLAAARLVGAKQRQIRSVRGKKREAQSTNPRAMYPIIVREI